MIHSARFEACLVLACFVVVGSSSLPAVAAAGQPVPMDWGNLDAGPFEVGFKVFNEYDYGRTFGSLFDYSGNPLRDNNARPVQVWVWYPAEAGANLPRLKLRDFVVMATREVDFAANPEGDIEVFLRKFRVEQPREPFDEVTLAQQNAPIRSGAFPVVLYAPSLGASPVENVVLCEHLASHGYIVASSPSMGEYVRQMIGDEIDLYSQVQDLEFLFSYIRSFPGVDMDRVGVVGFSWGGLSNVVFAMHNAKVKAVVSLDGSIGFEMFGKRPRDFILYHPDTFRAPLMLLTQSAWRYPEIRDFSLIEHLPYSDLTIGWVHDLKHAEFSSTLPLLYGYETDDPNAPTKDVRRILAGYHVVCQYTKTFLDAWLKESAEAQGFLRRSPAENGIPEDVLTMTRRPARVAPPLPDQFLEIIRTDGVARAVRIFKETRALNPSYMLFRPGQLIQLSGEYETKGAVSDATELLEMACIAYPENYNACSRLATIYAAHGQVDQAVKTYERFVKLNPTGVFSQLAAEAAEALAGRK